MNSRVKQRVETSPPAAGPADGSFPLLLETLMQRVGEDGLLALLVIQIDEFNRIGSTLGRNANEGLQSTYQATLAEIAGAQAHVVRLAERKFAIALLGRDSEQQIMLEAEQILKQARPQMSVGRHQFLVDTVMGVALFPKHAESSDELLRRAELGLLAARKAGTPLELYRPDSTLQVASIWLLESELEAAVRARKLELYYQPKIRIADNATVGIEALLRWFNAAKGYVPPEMFVSIAERTGLIEPLTQFVLDSVVEDVQQWPTERGPLDISVNVAPALLREPELIDYAARCADRLMAFRATLTLEVTESVFMEDPEACLRALETLRKHGIKISIDDFGAGFSSLSYLKQIPATELKIDKTFVQNMAGSPTDRHIVKSVVDLAHGFGMQVVAEGVEDEASFVQVRKTGCDVAQGFFITPALAPAQMGEWLAEHPPQSEGGRRKKGKRPPRRKRSGGKRTEAVRH